MALYLGSEKLGVTIPVSVGGSDSSSGVPCATGTVVVDDGGTLTFPELDFTPNLIAVWNITTRDLKAEAEENGEDWDDSYVRYVQEGLMLFAIYNNDVWVSQITKMGSNEAYISNESFNIGSAISVSNNQYHYYIDDSGSDEFIGAEFNYAIYG